jgi:membrane fusion protein (multidrug efflux system)
MNRIKIILRRLVVVLLLVGVVLSGAVFGMYKMRWNIPALNTTKIYANLDSLATRLEPLRARLVGMYQSAFGKHEAAEHHEEGNQIVVTNPSEKDVNIVLQYVCQIRSRRHIDVCALEDGYLKEITLKEGQAVKEGDVLFEINSVLYQARLDAEIAERNFAQMELNNTKRLFAANGVSEQEVKLYEAKLAKAQAKVELAKAEMNFTKVKAPFDGIIDRFRQMQGSLVKEGDVLTTLSDNSVMWVYFNVPEKRYLEYMADVNQNLDSPDVELVLANQKTFQPNGTFDPIRRGIGAIEGQFNNETGNVAFRADFENKERLLRHGQTGNVRINRLLKGAIVIPQRATFEILDKRYVFVIDKDDVVHQRPIVVEHEQDDVFVVQKRKDENDKKGLDVNDKIIFEGVRQVHDGQKLEPESIKDIKPEEALKNQKFHAE